MRRLKTIIAAGILSMFAGPALAMQIEGEIGFGGSFSPIGADNFGSATGVSIDTVSVFGGTGDFTGIQAGSPDFFVSSLNLQPSFNPSLRVWEVGAFSFDLETLAIQSQEDNFINIIGAGTLMANGFENTPGTWTLTTTTAGNQFFTFASNTVATPDVPEPATLLLIGTGLLAAGGMAARRRAAA